MEQKVEVIGNVASDPELKTLPGGRTVAKVSIAADQVTKDGEALDPAKHKWHTAIFWEDRAKEVAAELKKGDKVQVAGNSVSREYTGRDGQLKTAVEIHRASYEVLERRERIEVSGNLTADPKLETARNGKPVVHIEIAADQVVKNGEKLDPKTNKFHRAVFWEDRAEELAASLKKGSPVKVTGEPVVKEYEGKDGQKRVSSEIHRGQLEVLERGRSQGNGRPSGRAQEEMSR